MRKLVGDLMTTEVAVIRCDREIHELERLLLEQRVHGVPVVDEADRIVGVVSQTDLLSWHFETGVDGASFHEAGEPAAGKGGRLEGGLRLANVRTALVREVMSPLVHVIGPERTVAEAAARLIRERIHRLVVVDDDFRVVGILSAHDVLAAVPGVDSFLDDRAASRVR